MSTSQLYTLLQSNVLDLRFTRRRSKPGFAGTRRMLCTLDESILNSVNGRTVLNYLPGSGKMSYNTTSKTLCVVWDILMQQFRMVPADATSVIEKIPGNDTFWEYFNEKILPMSSDEKLVFMNS